MPVALNSVICVFLTLSYIQPPLNKIHNNLISYQSFCEGEKPLASDILNLKTFKFARNNMNKNCMNTILLTKCVNSQLYETKLSGIYFLLSIQEEFRRSSSSRTFCSVTQTLFSISLSPVGESYKINTENTGPNNSKRHYLGYVILT